MKTMISFVLTVSFMIPASSFAANSGRSNFEVLNSYLKIQESLANDSLVGISTAAEVVAKNTQDEKVKTSAQALSHDASLESARKHFKELSLRMDQWAKNEKQSGIDRVSCPMVNAPWLQKHGAIKNPYYGKKMQGCGEVQK